MKISFIQEPNKPTYLVDFDRYRAKEEVSSPLTISKKIQLCAQRSFLMASLFLESFKSSIYVNLGNAGISFKHTVLGYQGPSIQGLSKFKFPIELSLVVFKIIFWIANLGWGISTNTVRLLREKISSRQTILLKKFANDEINLWHIRTNEIALDASLVPDDIKVSDLRDILAKINFTDKEIPGYMAPTVLKEGKRIFTKELLKKSLEDFIRRVNTREAFIGTPPSYDTSRLRDFYQKIEDAVRLSIYKVIRDVNDFEQKNGTNYALFDEEKKKKYNDLLETRARVALDLAIAGAHCGGRYIGEAMDIYYSLYAEGGIQKNRDLQETLIEILAEKRKEIAKRDIQKYLGANAHAFTTYMGMMGKLVGIPGTGNIIDHLSKPFNTYNFLDKFFQSYTVDAIIETIQEKAKTSQVFRERIIDWIKDQVGDWNLQQWNEKIYPIVLKLEEIQKSSPESTSFSRDFETLQELLSAIKEKGSLPKMESGWDNFLIEFLSLDEVKQLQSSLQDRHKIQLGCSVNALGFELIEKLQKEIVSERFTPIPQEQYMPIFIEKAKIAEMNQFLLSHNLIMPDDTLRRIVRNEVNLNELVKSCIDRARCEDFLNCFNQNHDLSSIVENGLPKELLEWILVSQGVLYPQIEHKLELSDLPVDPFLLKQYINAVYEEFINSYNTLKIFHGFLDDEKLLEKLFTYVFANKKRYTATESKKEQVLTWVFNQSFQRNPENVIKALERVNGGKRAYPYWKEVCLIKLPEISANLLDNPLLRMALILFSLSSSLSASRQARKKIEYFLITKAFPFVVDHSPIQIARAGNSLLEARDFFVSCLPSQIVQAKNLFYRHSFKMILGSILLERGMNRLPRHALIPYLNSAFKTIGICQSFSMFAVPQFFDIFTKSLDISQKTSYLLQRISSNAKKEKLAINRKEALSFWNLIIQDRQIIT